MHGHPGPIARSIDVWLGGLMAPQAGGHVVPSRSRMPLTGSWSNGLCARGLASGATDVPLRESTIRTKMVTASGLAARGEK